jgi:hypothetical protein
MLVIGVIMYVPEREVDENLRVSLQRALDDPFVNSLAIQPSVPIDAASQDVSP